MDSRDQEKTQLAVPKANEPATTRPDAASAPSTSRSKSAAADLDFAVEEIQRPELMKEGFVGQER